jgi:ABC-2 type transport system ATP-binding protein
MCAVRLEAVSTRRPGTSQPLLREVDLQLTAGDRVVVVGANGSGKSTLLRTVAGLSRPVSGRVVGRPETIAYLPDRVEPPPRLTGRHWLQLVLATRGVEPTHADLDHVAGRLGVSPSLDELAGTLSRGNLVKVGLVQLLLSGAELLVLDEPYAALDPDGAAALDLLLAARAADGAIVLEAAPHTDAAPGRTTYRIQGRALVGDHHRPSSPPYEGTRVRVVLARGDTAPQTRWVPAAEVDDALREALAAGWSVREVRADPEADA